MKRFPALERRVAQHHSHPQWEAVILGAPAAEGKNADHVTAAPGKLQVAALKILGEKR